MNKPVNGRSSIASRVRVIAACALAIGTAGMWVAVNHPDAQASEGGEPRYFAITNARIVRVSDPVIESGTVVIAKGLIQAVGATVTIPPEAWVIDGKGLTVYPGLIDAGSTVGLGEDNGDEKGKKSPNVNSPEDRPGTTPWRATADEVKTDDKRIESWRSAGFTTTLALPTGGIFPGQAAVLNLAGERPGDFVVRPMASLPISLKPVGGFFGFPDSLMGAIGYVRQVVDDTNWYSQAEPIYEANPTKNERIPYDRTERTLSAAMRDKEVVLLPANNSVQILRALRLADEWKFAPVLFGGQQSYAVVDAIAAKKAAVLVSLKWPERPKDADPDAPQTLRELRFRDRAPGTPAALAKANVKFGFYSEGLSSSKDIFKSLKKAMDAGLTSDAAVKALTLDAADILGLSDRMGSISTGKIANLVVTDGDIFNEKTKMKHVFVDGRWFEIHDDAKPDKSGEKSPADDEDSDGDVSHQHSRDMEGVGR